MQKGKLTVINNTNDNVKSQNNENNPPVELSPPANTPEEIALNMTQELQDVFEGKCPEKEK